MSGAKYIGLITVRALLPAIFLGLMGLFVLSGNVAWRPATLVTDSRGTITSLAAYSGGLFAGGYYSTTLNNSLCRDSVCYPTPGVQFFLREIDSNLRERWSVSVGNATSGSPVVAVGTDKVAIAVTAWTLDGNNSTAIRGYDFNGNLLWAKSLSRPIQQISAWNSGFFLVGNAKPGFRNKGIPGQIFVEKLDQAGNEVWSHTLANSSGLVTGISTGLSGIRVTGWVNGSLTNQPLAGLTDSVVLTYDFDGNLTRIDEFGSGLATGVSEDGNAIYVGGISTVDVLGPIGSYSHYALGYLRKYSLSGNFISSTSFLPLDIATPGPIVSTYASGIYLIANKGAGPSMMKFDSSLNKDWSFQPQGEGIGYTLALNSEGVYIGGYSAGVSKFSQSSTLIFFGINPPYSFALTIAPFAVLLAFLSRNAVWRLVSQGGKALRQFLGRVRARLKSRQQSN